MSEHDEGYGGNADPILEFESDFTNALRNGSAPVDQPWGMNVHNAHRSEGPLMNSGAGKPGQPLMGQRSIFGTGRGPVFAQVPAYTPVTRAPAGFWDLCTARRRRNRSSRQSTGGTGLL